MANAIWYTIEAKDLNGERVRFSSTKRAEIDRCGKRWGAQGFTCIHIFR